MLTRRNLLPAAAATVALAAIPTALFASKPIPHIYLAKIEEFEDHWLETWRHSTTVWQRSISYPQTMNFPYEDRLAEMSYQYAWDMGGCRAAS
jgi:hypothetical protein